MRRSVDRVVEDAIKLVLRMDLIPQLGRSFPNHIYIKTEKKRDFMRVRRTYGRKLKFQGGGWENI